MIADYLQDKERAYEIGNLQEGKKNWYKIDATNLIVGRLASEITKILRGKKKTSFTPNMDDGDFVIVTNARKIKFTGKKFSKKIYYKHTGFPSGGFNEHSCIGCLIDEGSLFSNLNGNPW